MRARAVALLAAAVLAIGGDLSRVAPPAYGAENEPIHASADKEVWNRALNRVELIGHASVHQVGESLSADYIVLNQTLRTLDAHGNCIYIANDSVIFGEEMHFNLDTRTGTVIAGRVANDRFTLSGERINKLGAGHFQTHWGDYSTCRDCGQSWTISARDVDMQVDGYAYMHDVSIKVKDASALWIPYLILPMKTRRQTGFLYPEYALNSNNGFQFVEPFFWAISRSADMTIGAGEYTARGHRAEWEGRYVLSPRSQGKANFYYLNDKSFTPDVGNPTNNPNRWALEAGAVQEITPNLEAKIKLAQVSDNLYPFSFADISQRYEQFLTSSANVAFSSEPVNANLGIDRFQNLLNINPDPRVFDSTTVQAFPSLSVTTRDKPLFDSPIMGGLSVDATNFTRPAGPFDLDSIKYGYGLPAGVPGAVTPPPTFSDTYNSSTNPNGTVDPVRKATRFILNPSLYTVLTPFEGVSLVPSVQYFGYFYDFHQEIPNLTRAYVLAQLDVVTQLEKVYDVDDPRITKRKHLIRPILTYSYIPYVQDNPNSWFVNQINYANSQNNLGYNFDDQDIIPVNVVQNQSTYFTPLGNSLTYGFKTQIIDRVESAPVAPPPKADIYDEEAARKALAQSPSATYRIPFEFSAGETFNIYDLYSPEIPGQPHPFTRAFANLITNYDNKITTNSSYYYDPTLPGIRSEVFSSVNWVLDRGMHQRILSFDRSLTLSYTWNQRGYTGTGYENIGAGTDAASIGINFSLSDYILPNFTYAYDFVAHHWTGISFNLAFQSPSQCWKIATGISFDPTLGRTLNLPYISLNLTGNGFEGVNEVANSSTIPTQ